MADVDLTLPALHATAEEAASYASRRYRRIKVSEIALPVIAVLLATIARTFAWFGIPSAVAVGALALLRLVQQANRAESDWHQARASAEAIKVHAWSYAVRAADFDDRLIADDEADAEFLAQLRADVADDTELLIPRPGAEITPEMRQLRAAPLEDRRAAYLHGRVEDQISWYSRRARDANRTSNRLDLAHYVLDAIAIVAAIAVATSQRTSLATIVAVASATAGAVLTWSGVRRYSYLAQQYGDTATDLKLMREGLAAVDTESDWQTKVHEAEVRLDSEHHAWHNLHR